METEKKAFFFIGTLSSGGAERAVSNISLSFPKNIEQKIILFGSGAKVVYPHSADIVYLDSFDHKTLLDKARAFVSRFSKIRSLKRSKDVTMISFLEYPNLLNSLTRSSGKSIVSVRNHMSTKYKKGLKSRFWEFTIKNLYNRTDEIIAVSHEIKRDLVERYGIDDQKIRVIHNSYPVEDIQKFALEDLENEYKDIFAKPVVITSGRLNKQKGHWHLIRSFFEVKQKIPDAKLVFLGEGELKNYLANLALELGIEKDVHFLGFQKNPFKFISRSKIFAMSSLYEGFPNALAEAMACGVPIVSSDCLSGPREILAPDEFEEETIDYGINKDRYGVLTPVCDGIRYDAKDVIASEEKVMAGHIIKLLEDKKLAKYYESQSLQRIEDFNIKRIIRQWEAII